MEDLDKVSDKEQNLVPSSPPSSIPGSQVLPTASINVISPTKKAEGKVIEAIKGYHHYVNDKRVWVTAKIAREEKEREAKAEKEKLEDEKQEAEKKEMAETKKQEVEKNEKAEAKKLEAEKKEKAETKKQEDEKEEKGKAEAKKQEAEKEKLEDEKQEAEKKEKAETKKEEAKAQARKKEEAKKQETVMSQVAKEQREADQSAGEDKSSKNVTFPDQPLSNGSIKIIPDIGKLVAKRTPHGVEYGEIVTISHDANERKVYDIKYYNGDTCNSLDEKEIQIALALHMSVSAKSNSNTNGKRNTVSTTGGIANKKIKVESNSKTGSSDGSNSNNNNISYKVGKDNIIELLDSDDDDDNKDIRKTVIEDPPLQAAMNSTLSTSSKVKAAGEHLNGDESSQGNTNRTRFPRGCQPRELFPNGSDKEKDEDSTDDDTYCEKKDDGMDDTDYMDENSDNPKVLKKVIKKLHEDKLKAQTKRHR